MRKYAEEFSVLYPQLIDLIAADFAMVSNTAEIFLSHCSMAEIMSGLNSRKYFKGVIRCKGSSPYDCYVVLHTGSGQRKSVVIRGKLSSLL